MERFDGKKMRYAVNIPGFVVRDILTNVCGVGSTHVGRMLSQLTGDKYPSLATVSVKHTIVSFQMMYYF